MERLIENTLFASRWLLAPMYHGLVVTVAALFYVFGVELVRFVVRVPSMTVDDAIKRQFGYVKTRYRGLAKNHAQFFTLFALGNLFLVRRRLLA